MMQSSTWIVRDNPDETNPGYVVYSIYAATTTHTTHELP